MPPSRPAGGNALLDGLAPRTSMSVWMSHGDRVRRLPPGFKPIASSANAPLAGMADESRRFYGLQFHPEVTHTEQGQRIIERFVRDICACPDTWRSGNIIAREIAQVRAQVGRDKVLLGLSGGVDSSVVAALLHEALGDQLICVFVDTGLLRLHEGDQVMDVFAEHLGVKVIRVNAEERFLKALAGVADPEAKRKIIGRLFVEVFDEEAGKLRDVKWLAQGTIYPDVIESAGTKTGKAHVIKSHHNVGGLPENMKLKLVEPIRELFKDEVRRIGVELGLPREMVYRHPFPGPGPRRADPGRGEARVRRPAAQGRPHLHRGTAPGRPLRQRQPGLRGVPARALGRRDGRRPAVRLGDRAPRRRDHRLHDGPLGAPALRLPRPRLAADHQRDRRASPG